MLSSKKVAIVVLFVTLVAAAGWYFYYSQSRTVSIKIGNTELNVSLAITPAEMRRGLSNRESLADDQGMLFVFTDPTVPSFWMKDMAFPIDIIWINNRGEIVGINHDLSPDSYPQLFSPPRPVRYVLEVKAGWAKEHNIQLGDKVLMPTSIF